MVATCGTTEPDWERGLEVSTLQVVRCQECRKRIPAPGGSCLFCTPSVSTQAGSSSGYLLISLFLLFLAVGLGNWMSEQNPAVSLGSVRWSGEQIEDAKEFWEHQIPRLQKAGLITGVSHEGAVQVIHVDGDQWRSLDGGKKRHLLREASDSNEFLGRTQYVEIRDHVSERLYGELKPPLVNEIYE